MKLESDDVVGVGATAGFDEVVEAVVSLVDMMRVRRERILLWLLRDRSAYATDQAQTVLLQEI